MKVVVLDDAAVLLAADDTVATAVVDLEAGRVIDSDAVPGDRSTVELAEEVPFGHKLALEPMEASEPVRKYGEVIGTANESIAPGEWVHTHNCEINRGRGNLDSAEGPA